MDYVGIDVHKREKPNLHFDGGRRAHRGERGDATRSVRGGAGEARSPGADAQPLRQWARQVAERRGKSVAVVGLARRLANILFAMWRDDVPFDRAALATRRRPVRPVA